MQRKNWREAPRCFQVRCVAPKCGKTTRFSRKKTRFLQKSRVFREKNHKKNRKNTAKSPKEGGADKTMLGKGLKIQHKFISTTDLHFPSPRVWDYAWVSRNKRGGFCRGGFTLDAAKARTTPPGKEKRKNTTEGNLPRGSAKPLKWFMLHAIQQRFPQKSIFRPKKGVLLWKKQSALHVFHRMSPMIHNNF